MVRLAGADVVLPDGIAQGATLVIDGERVAEIRRSARGSAGGSSLPLAGHLIVPGFVDVHLHGVAGVDTLDGGDAVERIAAVLPRFGVTAFCPTTVACPPDALRILLARVAGAREAAAPASARILPAHLESNFINAAYCGAQPVSCLRHFPEGVSARRRDAGSTADVFDAADVLAEIEGAIDQVGIVTLAPEVDGGLELVRWLSERRVRVSLGHSGATYEEAMAAFEAGATRATHLFNRMAPLDHRRPGLVGAVLQSSAVTAELICDGLHVHPAVLRATIAAKTPARIVAISDSTAAAALALGLTARLGGESIVARDGCARLGDGTMAGSTQTLDGAFRLLRSIGVSPVDAALMCATTPARDLGRNDLGAIAEGALADLAVLDPDGQVVQTWIAGRLAYERSRAD